MTTSHDPFDLRRLQSRARDVFARAARMQDLHGQAQAQSMGAQQRPGDNSNGSSCAEDAQNPQALLVKSAGQAVTETHRALLTAAQMARHAAQTDPVIARLNARINGAELLTAPVGAEVINVDLVEVVPEAAVAAGQPLLGLAPPCKR